MSLTIEPCVERKVRGRGDAKRIQLKVHQTAEEDSLVLWDLLVRRSQRTVAWIVELRACTASRPVVVGARPSLETAENFAYFVARRLHRNPQAC